MSTEDVALTNGHAPNAINPAGWYPDPADPRGLRYWDGNGWTDHRAHLSAPTSNPAVCACGVVATGTCRICDLAFCRSHISDQPRDDRPYLKRWDAWMCGGCIEAGRRQLRAEQLARCESVAPRLMSLGKIRSVRTFTGLRPRRTNLFSTRAGLTRPVRAARGYLIEYDSGEETSTYTGLAMSADGSIIYDVGAPVLGTASARPGPKLSRKGYVLRSTISIERLREATEAPTNDTWFEHAARAYLRGARRLQIEPDLSQPMERPDQAVLDAIAADNAIDLDAIHVYDHQDDQHDDDDHGRLDHDDHGDHDRPGGHVAPPPPAAPLASDPNEIPAHPDEIVVELEDTEDVLVDHAAAEAQPPTDAEHEHEHEHEATIVSDTDLPMATTPEDAAVIVDGDTADHGQSGDGSADDEQSGADATEDDGDRVETGPGPG